MLRLKLFGEFDLTEASGVAVAVTSRKDAALLAYLCLQDRPVDRSVLTDLLWPDRAEEQARKSLRQSLVALRRLLNRDSELLPADGGERISLDHARISVDVREFEALAGKGHDSAAVELYAGPLLERFPSPSTPYAAWLDVERARLGDMACGILADLAEAHLANSEWERAMEVSRRLVETDPLREAGHRLLMRALNGAGRRNEALQQFHRLKDMLRDELDVSPDNMTADLYQSIREPAAWATSAVSTATVPNRDDAPLLLPDKPSIAVLPFDNMSGDPEQEYFADGIAEDIITALSHLPWFFVVARNSSFAFKDQSTDVKQLARELDVQYLVEGSVRKAGNRVRITAQLIDARNNRHVWAYQYDRELTDIFAVQDEITEKIVGAVAPEFMAAEMNRSRQKEERNLDTWDLLMQAHWHLYRFNKESNQVAKVLLNKIIAIDPNNDLALSDLATSYTMGLPWNWYDEPAKALSSAREAAQKAVAINDRNVSALLALANVDAHSGKYDKAVSKARDALDLAPNSPDAHGWLGTCLLTACEFEEAEKELNTAIRLGPRNLYNAFWYAAISVVLFLERRYEECIECCEDALKLPNTLPAVHRPMAASYAMLDRMTEARAAMVQLRTRVPGASAESTRSFPLKDPAALTHYVDALHKAETPA